MVVPDALRAFAITLVVLNHLFLIAHPVLGRPIRLGFLGIWGVNMFFVLSGFLLGREFVRALLGTRPFPKIDRFLTRRFLRIYPLYFVAVLVSVVLVDAFLHHVSTRVILEHIFLLEGADAQAIFDLNIPLWTMGIDAAFYLALPLIMGAVFLATRGRSQFTKACALWCTLAVFGIAAIGARFLGVSRHPQTLQNFAETIVFVRTPLGMSVAFVLGIAIATLVEVLPRDRIPQLGYASLAGSGAIIGLIELQLRLENSAITPGLGSSLRMTIIDPLAAFSAALVLFGLFQGRFAVVARIASSRAIVAFASLAYAIYLFHYPILEILFARLLHDNSKLSTFAELTALCVLVVLPVAWIASRFVEQPFLVIKDRMRGDARAGYESVSPVA